MDMRGEEKMANKFATDIKNVYGELLYHKVDDWKMTRTRLATILSKTKLSNGEFVLTVYPTSLIDNESIGNLKFLD